MNKRSLTALIALNVVLLAQTFGVEIPGLPLS